MGRKDVKMGRTREQCVSVHKTCFTLAVCSHRRAAGLRDRACVSSLTVCFLSWRKDRRSVDFLLWRHNLKNFSVHFIYTSVNTSQIAKHCRQV